MGGRYSSAFWVFARSFTVEFSDPLLFYILCRVGAGGSRLFVRLLFCVGIHVVCMTYGCHTGDGREWMLLLFRAVEVEGINKSPAKDITPQRKKVMLTCDNVKMDILYSQLNGEWSGIFICGR